jgi:hypothetical protein
MTQDAVNWMNLLNAACWPVCFWWMHRISSKQNGMLADLHAQQKKVREISDEGREIIKEIEPKVQKVAAKIDEAVAAKTSGVGS